MFRRLVALLVFLTAWAILAHMVERPAPVTTIVAASTSAAAESAAPRDTGETDSRWAAARAITSVTETRWRSSGTHAALATVPTGQALVETCSTARLDRPAPDRSRHLYHIPLLI